MNSNAKVVGLDIAKEIFVAVGIDEKGKVVFKKKLYRSEVLAFFANLSSMAIGIEACAGAHYWARELNKLGHDAKLIAAQHVKPFVSGSPGCHLENRRYRSQALGHLRLRKLRPRLAPHTAPPRCRVDRRGPPPGTRGAVALHRVPESKALRLWFSLQAPGFVWPGALAGGCTQGGPRPTPRRAGLA